MKCIQTFVSQNVVTDVSHAFNPRMNVISRFTPNPPKSEKLAGTATAERGSPCDVVVRRNIADVLEIDKKKTVRRGLRGNVTDGKERSFHFGHPNALSGSRERLITIYWTPAGRKERQSGTWYSHLPVFAMILPCKCTRPQSARPRPIHHAHQQKAEAVLRQGNHRTT